MTLLPKVVRQRLEVLPVLSEHLSAEMLSALPENSLNQQERTQLLTHLSGCSDCRQIIWHMLPELNTQPAGAQQATFVPDGTPWFKRWFSLPIARWSLVTACLLVVGSAVVLEQGAFHSERIALSTKTTAARDSMTPQKAIKSPEPDLNDNQHDASLSAEAKLQPSPAVAANSNPRARTTSGNVTAQTQTQSAMNRAAGAKAFMGTTSANYAVRDAVTGKTFPRWILTADGLLQRSLDAGKTWQPIVISGNSAALHAIAAHGPRIWVGGAGGVLYHSSNAGQDWARITPTAQGKTIAGDVIGIEFPTARAGKLTTSLQETWATADGGKTWQKK